MRVLVVVGVVPVVVGEVVTEVPVLVDDVPCPRVCLEVHAMRSILGYFLGELTVSVLAIGRRHLW